VSRINPRIWSHLVEAFEAAEAEAARAEDARRHAPAPANDEQPSGLDETSAALTRVRDAWEDRLLTVACPSVAAAAYQLRLFARRYHGAELAAPAPDDESPAAVTLRRIWGGLQNADWVGVDWG
jgi:hypothetical protein